MKERDSGEFKEDLQIFLEEVGELLANTEENLVELEKSPSDTELIQEVFRAMHTIKGGAATLGFQDGVEVTHLMESILDQVRSGAQELTPAMVDVLFLVLDWLEEWKGALEGQGERPPAGEIVDKIRRGAGGTHQDDRQGIYQDECLGIHEDDFRGNSQHEHLDTHQREHPGIHQNYRQGTPKDYGLTSPLTRQIEECLSEGRPVHKLTVRFRPDADLLSVRCYQVLTLVAEESDVIGSEPSIEDVEVDKVHDVIAIYLVSTDDGMAAKRVADSVQDVVQSYITPYSLDLWQEGNGAGLAGGSTGTAEAGGTGRARPGGGSGNVASAGPAETGGTAEAGGRETQRETNGSGQSNVSVRRTSIGRTVRVDVDLLDFLLNMVGELVIDRTRLTQIASKLLVAGETSVIGNEVAALASHLQRISQELQEGIMRARLLPLKNIFTKFPRMIRDLANRCGKHIDLEIHGENTELDRTVLEAIDDPLIHILRNAVDHGIETPDERKARGKPERGKVSLSAWHEENQVLVRVTDDGSGIDAENVKRSAIRKGLITADAAAKLSEREAMELIFMPGFSTSQVATQVSGRGVGMDVVRANLERISGHIEVRSQVGLGTSVTLRLPLTLAIMRALLVKCSNSIYAIPTSLVEEVLAVREEEVKTIRGRAALTVRGKVFPLVSLEGSLREDPWSANGFRYAVLTRSNDEPLALGVDDLVGRKKSL